MKDKRKNWFLRHKILTGVLVIIAVFVLIGTVGDDNSRNTENNTQSNTNGNSSPTQAVQQAPTVVDATALIADYDKNKIAAQDKYTNKTVETTGYIKNISDDITGKYYLSLNPTNEEYYFGATISCYFPDKSAKSEITSLENGQSVTVQGKMDDMSFGIVVMNDCKVVK